MKKILITIMLLAGTVAQLTAQTTVTGTVTDRKGNPIPGAKVEIPKSNESVLTELDGTFSLSTQTAPKYVKVYYVGMQTKKKKVSPDMTIKMSKTNWWNEKPDHYRWFVEANAAFATNEYEKPSLGLTIGRVKHIGFYVKGVYSSKQSTFADMDKYNSPYWTTGKTKHSFSAAVCGFMVRLGCPLYFNYGIGYSEDKFAWQVSDGNYIKVNEDSHDGPCFDMGLTLKVKKLMLSGGVTGPDTPCINTYIGIGYSF